MRLQDHINVFAGDNQALKLITLIDLERRTHNLHVLAQALPTSLPKPALEAFKAITDDLASETGERWSPTIGLEHFGADEHLTVSNEFFSGLISKIKAAIKGTVKEAKAAEKPSGKKSIEKPKDLFGAIEVCEKYFANDEWLSEQTFNEGKIEAEDFSGLLVVGSSVPGNPISAAQAAVKAYVDYTQKYCDQLVAYVKACVALNEKGKDLDKGAAEALYKKEVGKLKPPTARLADNLMGGLTSPNKDRGNEMKIVIPKGPKELEALDQPKVKATAELIIVLLEAAVKIEGLLTIAIYDQAWFVNTPPLAGHHELTPAAVLREFGPNMYPIDQLLAMAGAFDRWIDRSVK